MKNRRTFLKGSASLIGASFLPETELSSVGEPSGSVPVVRNIEQGDTYYVRENTPITFTISKKSDNISSLSMCLEELIPGSAIPVHKHLNEDEYFYVIAGTGIVIIDEKEFPFKPGTSVLVPKNTWHGFKNTGNEKIVFTFGYSPAGFEEFFREVGTPKGQEFKPKPKEEFDRIAKKYGMVFK